MGAVVEDVDYYALLEVAPEATLQEIKTAYRKRSLRVHPDRNPDNPQAAALFNDLRVASEVLLDPTQRASFDALLAARNARKLRFSALDSKRKAMAEDLDRRERDFKKSKGEEDQRDREKRSELERLKEEGRRMREAREKVNSGMVDRDEEVDRIREQERRRREMEEQTGVVELGLMDTTLTIKWAKPRRATIGDKDALLSFLRLLLNPLDPEVDMILSVDRIPKGRANVKFKTLAAAVRLMEAKGKGEGALWEGVEVNWAGKKAPDALGGAKVENKAPPSFASSFPISMLVDSDEDRILAQLRAKEREKLIEELRRQDEEEA